MKLLFIHADHIAFEAKKPALKSAPQLAEGEQTGRMEETLVMFYSVEKVDEGHVDDTVAKAVENLQDVARQVKTNRVMLYPYAHLSNQLAPPKVAQEAGEKLKQAVKAAGFETGSAPFGWYKAFDLKAKGHPLSELSRSIALGTAPAPVAPAAGPAAVPHAHDHAHHHGHQHGIVESEALKRESKIVSTWYVLTPEGVLTKAEEFDFEGHPQLKDFYLYETKGSRKAEQEPPHVRLMQELELADYEPGSDPGNFRWYPKGQLVKRLLEERVSDLCAAAGAMRVETPIMYDYEHPALKKYLDRFPARQYVLKSEEKEYFLRFAACFGQYLIGHDMTMSYKHLPVRLYELTHYSFRREQRGELSGLRRLRTFTMPDMHTFVADPEQARTEFLEQFKLGMKYLKDIEVPYEAGVRFVRSYFDENREFAIGLAKTLGRPILIEMWDERFFYFVMKFEFNVVDSQGKCSALSTVQIDVENPERFGIHYVDADNQKRTPLLLHASVSGSIDRNLYALLETQAKLAEKGVKPALPFWLAPTQVRILAVSDAYKENAMALAERLTRETRARVDVDDRDLGIGRKIRDAEKEWVPLIIVFGEKEATSGQLPVRVRGGENAELDEGALARLIREKQGDLPPARLAVPAKLSARPVFRG
ncbi:MAG TPA: threonine--tRNA ligase [Candidatus Thermoplasmatota archaeon]|nr:threonine--tRNA ligase [Candidatus Thermoplasmatota archaeon]